MKPSSIAGNREEKMNEWWQAYVEGLDQSLANLESEIGQAKEMKDICTDEWCAATEHYIDDLANAVFTIHEPRWINDEQSQRLKKLKRKIHDLYAGYKQAAGR